MASIDRQELMDYLDKLHIKTQTIEHPALHTVEDSKTLRGNIPGGHTKNLFLKDKKNNFFLLVVDEDATIDMKTMHKRLGSGRLSFGNPDYLMEKLGVSPGSVTAFSIINDTENTVRIILDQDLMKNTVINCHPLTNTATTSIKAEDLITFVKSTQHEPEIISLTSDIFEKTDKANGS